ncbi:MAG: hypothetical protein F9K36_10565, partial [Burkholderiaceae bacterium]
RHVSPAFADDPVRLLRLARFAARWPGRGTRPGAARGPAAGNRPGISSGLSGRDPATPRTAA